MADKKKPASSMEVTLKVNALEIKNASITADGRIIGLIDWPLHKVKVIILPEREEGADKLLEGKEVRSVAAQREKEMGNNVDMNKLMEDLPFVDPEQYMYEVVCPKCGYETKTFDVAIGKKRKWVKKKCEKCSKKGDDVKMIFKNAV